jgi:hypothetical protein
MQRLIIALALTGLLATGCDRDRSMFSDSGEPRGTQDVTALGLFGGANVNVHMNQFLCAGRVTLNNGAAELKDSCFTGDSNVVVCTDMTNANAVRCTPSAGALSVGGSGGDAISYARLK